MLRNWKRNSTGQYLILQYHAVLSKILPRLVGDESAIRAYYRKKSGRELNLLDPKSFSEKQQYYKLHARIPLMAKCADKYDVRDYVAMCGHAEILNECLGLYRSVAELQLERLPNSFVLKATHGSGFNLIVRDKTAVNWRAWKRIMRAWLHQDIYWSGREWVYRDLQRRIVAEQYLDDGSGELRDYKFFCFNGHPRFVQVEIGRYGAEKSRNFYDLDWNLLPFGKEIPHRPDKVVPPPVSLESMLAVARSLSSPFSFVRVDLYEVREKPVFGELTFFPAGGSPDFVPNEYDRVVGDMWELHDA